jgi:hypothetical protein
VQNLRAEKGSVIFKADLLASEGLMNEMMEKQRTEFEANGSPLSFGSINGTQFEQEPNFDFFAKDNDALAEQLGAAVRNRVILREVREQFLETEITKLKYPTLTFDMLEYTAIPFDDELGAPAITKRPLEVIEVTTTTTTTTPPRPLTAYEQFVKGWWEFVVRCSLRRSNPTFPERSSLMPMKKMRLDSCKWPMLLIHFESLRKSGVSGV